MIQPLKSSKTTWFVYWLDLEEPVPANGDYFLPTLLIVSDSSGAPLSAPEVLEELDQLRVENYLLKLFDKFGAPDRLAVGVSEEWDDEAWTAFAQENRVEIDSRNLTATSPTTCMPWRNPSCCASAAMPRASRSARTSRVDLSIPLSAPARPAKSWPCCAPRSTATQTARLPAWSWPTWSFRMANGKPASPPTMR